MKMELNNNFTSYHDDLENPICVGDKLYSEWNYYIIVVQDKDGDYFGKLICDNNHPCKNMRYALNNGQGYKKVNNE